MNRTTFSTADLILLALLFAVGNLAICTYDSLPLMRELMMLLLGLFHLRAFRHITDQRRLSIGLSLYFAGQNTLCLALEFLLLNSFLDYMIMIDRVGGTANWLQFFCNDLYARALEKWDAYLWLMGCMAAACLLQTILRSDRAKDTLSNLKKSLAEVGWIKIILEALQPEDLDFYVRHFLENGAFDALFHYCDAMPATEKSKNELLDCIDRYDLRILYDTLFEKCRDLLGEEEYAYYQQLYDKKFYPDEEDYYHE